MIKQSDFKPAWWLRNRHCQTIWQRIVRRRPCQVALQRERLELPDGDFLDLDWNRHQQGPTVIILHGLAGSIDSPYAKGMMEALDAAGIRAVLMHFRGCSGEPNRLHRGYHSGETTDLAHVVKTLSARFPSDSLHAVGYSLGGNVLLKWLGETAQLNPLKSAVAVSVPFDLAKSAKHMSQSLSRFYQWWLIRHLKSDIRAKYADKSAPIDLSNLEKWNDFRLFDDNVTAPLHGFASAAEYYRLSSSRQFLKSIAVQTLILHALDDPFMSEDTVPTAEELSDQVELELSQKGGHVGFIANGGQFWLEQRIVDYLKKTTSA